MEAYFLFDNLRVIDAEKLDIYKKRVGPLVQKFDGRYVVLGGRIGHAEGPWKPNHPVMIAFPDYEAANAWYGSDEYQELKIIRTEAVDCNVVLLEGFNPAP